MPYCPRCEQDKPECEFGIRQEKCRQPRREPYCKPCTKLYLSEYYYANIVRHIVGYTKVRARRLGIPFDLKPEDIVIPDTCPVLGIKLRRRSIDNKRTCSADDSPSLDRLNPKLGYVRGNVRVISLRANRLKSDGAIAEFEAIIKYMKESVA